MAGTARTLSLTSPHESYQKDSRFKQTETDRDGSMFGTGRLTLGLVPDPTGWPASDTDHRKHSVAVVADLLNGKVEDTEPRIPG